MDGVESAAAGGGSVAAAGCQAPPVSGPATMGGSRRGLATLAGISLTCLGSTPRLLSRPRSVLSFADPTWRTLTPTLTHGGAFPQSRSHHPGV